MNTPDPLLEVVRAAPADLVCAVAEHYTHAGKSSLPNAPLHAAWAELLWAAEVTARFDGGAWFLLDARSRTVDAVARFPDRIRLRAVIEGAKAGPTLVPESLALLITAALGRELEVALDVVVDGELAAMLGADSQ